MSFAPEILEVIVDPTDRQSLHFIESQHCFYNERTHVRYGIADNGIGVLLADGAETVSDDEHNRLMELIAGGQSIATGTKR